MSWRKRVMSELYVGLTLFADAVSDGSQKIA